MDRNQIIGIVLICAILFGTWFFTRKSPEEIAAERRKYDSLVRVQKQLETEKAAKQNQAKNKDVIFAKDSVITDSVRDKRLIDQYGTFYRTATGTKQSYTLENQYIRLKIANQGGQISSVELKNHKTYDKKPLLLFEGEKNRFALNFFVQNRNIETNLLFFKPTTSDTIFEVKDGKKVLTLRLFAAENKYLEYEYSLEPNSYIVGFKMKLVGLETEIAQNTNSLDLIWEAEMPALEKGRDWEMQATTLYYKFFEDEVDYLSETATEEKEHLPTKIKWVAYKHQFFASILIADNFISKADVQIRNSENPKNLKHCYTHASLPFAATSNIEYPFKFYFGPNHYKTLQSFDLDLQEIIPLGWGIFGWVNRFAVIPLFNFLGSFISNFGIIILIMTLIIKIVLSPLTYRSFLSAAKMRVLKPQVDEIHAKIPKEKAMERQQAVMAMYRKAGVNPLGGCIPSLLQMPILIALFRFFPASIELRQQSFLWAEDLSSFDSIFNLPFRIPLYGDHVSLFALLMGIAIYFSTLLTAGQSNDSTSQMPGMKFMMYYMMPIMMVVWFNSYSSGLSYYYFLSNALSIVQIFIVRRMIDEESILEQLKANSAKKKVATKSKFQQRLEEMAKKTRL